MKREVKTMEVNMLKESKKNGCNLTMNKDVKKSPYEVGVVFGFTKKGNTYKSVQFVVDRNRFGMTLDYCKTKRMKNPINVIGDFSYLLSIPEKEGISFEFLCTMVLNYICYYPQIAEMYRKLQNQSLGFIVDIDANNIRNTSVWGGTMQELEEIIDNISKR